MPRDRELDPPALRTGSTLRTPSSASQGLTDRSEVDLLGLRKISLNLGVEQSPGSPRWAQEDWNSAGNLQIRLHASLSCAQPCHQPDDLKWVSSTPCLCACNHLPLFLALTVPLRAKPDGEALPGSAIWSWAARMPSSRKSSHYKTSMITD